jgi:signal transduction histidine kinase
MMKLGRVKEQEKVAEYGAYIEAEGRRLTQLINNILDFSSIESGRKTYEFEQADLREVVTETLEAFSERLKQGGCTAVFTPPEQSLPPVLIDADAITLAITNLLDNAIKYSGNGVAAAQKVITIRLERTESHVAVAVADRGIGIPPAEREKIFDKFYRVSTGLTHDVKGSGLGLALVRHIAAAHRGRIEVASEPGRGSVFTLWLPVVETERGA